MSIKTLLHDYESALHTNNTEAILGLYGAEPVFMPAGVSALVGRTAVRAGYERVAMGKRT